ncbi:MAG: anthranilate phosphoribosyltransferase [Phycisphaerae bacterium]
MKDLLHQLLRGTPLTAAQAESAFTDIMDGTADPAQTASLLTLLATRGGGEPTVDELTGAATVLRRHVVAVDAPLNVIDTCGTGGVGSSYFNISTAAALVAAAAGVPVAKHGNRSITSRSGSSDALRALGVNIDTSPEQEAHCLKTANICFAFAPKHHPAMKHVAHIRQTLGFSTIFNILGPLTNPAGARRQVVGTRSPQLADKLLEVLIRLGAQRALVVAGNDPAAGPLCEISISADTHIAEFAAYRPGTGEGNSTLRKYRIRPEDIGLRTHPPDSPELQIRSPEDSAARIRQVLTGLGAASRDIVLANAAAALWVGGAVDNLADGVQTAAKTIDSGAAHRTLEALVAASHAAL